MLPFIVIPINIDLSLCIKLFQRVEGNFVPKLFSICPVASLNFSILSRLAWLNQIMNNSTHSADFIEDVLFSFLQSFISSNVSVGEYGTIISLHSFNREWSGLNHLLEESSSIS